MDNSYSIHEGKVLEQKERLLRVQITLGEACQHCASQSGCMILSSKSRIIEVPLDKHAPQFETGETVNVKMTTHSGLKAVFYAYLLPTLLLIGAVGCAYALHAPERLIALVAVGMIVIYYLILYFFRKQVNRKFTFEVERRHPDSVLTNE